jgi:hypothetical protein
MRTTLRIDDDLFRELKQRARSEGKTLSELVNLALRRSLAAEKRPRRRVFRQRTRDLGRPSFDISRANAVAAALEDEVILGKLESPS